MTSTDRRFHVPAVMLGAWALFACNIATAAADQRINGLTRPDREARMQPVVEGRIADRLVREGQRVAEGDVMIRLDADMQEARVAMARHSASQTAAVARAERTHALAQARLKRLQDVTRNGAVPPWELQEAAGQADIAASDLKLAADGAQLEAHKLAVELTLLDQYQVKAPFAGHVVELPLSAGAPVKRGETVVVVADTSRLDIVGYVPAELMVALRIGGTYQAEIAAPFARRVPVVLDFLDKRIDPASRTARATFKLDNADLSIPAGIEASVVIPVQSQ
ncbi:MAG: efflux RND transporter periplasmic adaptor subunit [Hyphomicrobium aestuarii]|nr:efflux RND transporter periplasmic adaptor subunit [Hyphomicrobium aestuarii]